MPRVLTQTDVADFRERLCDAATRLFDSRGPEGFTMRELASELGVSAMTPYRYFKDKEDILAAVRARAFTRWAERLEAAFAGARTAAEKSRAVYEAYTAFAFNEPAAYKLMFDLSQPDEAEYPELVAASARAKRTMTDYVRELVTAGEIEGDPELIGRVFWASLHGAVVLKLAGKLTAADGYDFDRVSAESFSILFDGYRKK
ncbi:MAG: TetR/AcrR family transcriptional regulator [Alphaproteobacteria bacterium]|nr:TetR/AcrR family transcriptional regulator [Alphaproteobacteria bacterium]MBL7097708.1 TetR/AcrR family transcriptional regulator [Alphaproteobacteria bacterium]